MSYLTIDSVVRSYIADVGGSTLHKYLRYMKWAMEGLKDWHLQGDTEDKIASIKIDNKKAAAFPCDMISWSKLGFKVGDRVAIATEDSTILLTHNTDGGKKIANTKYNPPEMPLDLFTTPVVDGRVSSHNNVGYYDVNYQCKEFQFSSEVSSDCIYIKYKSSGFCPDSETTVNEVADKLIRDYIHWQEARFKFGDDARETFARKKEYGETYKRVRRQLEVISFEGILDVVRRSTDINR